MMNPMTSQFESTTHCITLPRLKLRFASPPPAGRECMVLMPMRDLIAAANHRWFHGISPVKSTTTENMQTSPEQVPQSVSQAAFWVHPWEVPPAPERGRFKTHAYCLRQLAPLFFGQPGRIQQARARAHFRRAEANSAWNRDKIVTTARTTVERERLGKIQSQRNPSEERRDSA